MYEAPKLERLGNFRELTLDSTKIYPNYDPILGTGANQSDGYARS